MASPAPQPLPRLLLKPSGWQVDVAGKLLATGQPG